MPAAANRKTKNGWSCATCTFYHSAPSGQRCSMCHAAEPGWDGIAWPPKGVKLETEAEIAHAAKRIYLQAGVSHAMPPGNLSYMEPEERAAIVRWFRSAGAEDPV